MDGWAPADRAPATLSEGTCCAVQSQVNPESESTTYVSNITTDLPQLRAQAIAQYQAGNLTDALSLLEQVVVLSPSDWQAWNMLGAVHGIQARFADCEACCRKAIELQPAIFSTYNNLGNALKSQNRTAEARQAYRRALEINPDYPEALNNLGNLERDYGATDDAKALFLKAIQLRPDYAQAYNNLGNVYRDEGDFDGAMTTYKKALEYSPNYLDALVNLGIVYQLEERTTDAIGCYRRTLAIDPDNQDAMFNLGVALLIQGDTHSSEQCLARVLEKDPSHINANYFLSAIRSERTPERSPREFVTSLFDTYAGTFDKHLVKDLEYRIPSRLYELFTSCAGTGSKLSLLDLGCGSGLSGEAFKEVACHMEGVDLSPKMIEKARARHIYDKLHVDDLLELLSDRSATYDLIVAADVFVYIGKLNDLFFATASALRAHGYFCFSIERHTGEQPYVLRQSGRYAHSLDYIESLIHQADFDLKATAPAIIRKERGTPIQGDIFLLQVNK
jgi:predicted TPR repeat methyltransferase